MNDQQPHFSVTRRAGGFCFVSGQLAFNANMEIVDGGIATQTRQCLENIKAAFSTDDVSMQEIVKITVWMTNGDDFWEFDSVYAEYFPDTPPVRTTIGASLVVPGAVIEMDAMAWCGD